MEDLVKVHGGGGYDSDFSGDDDGDGDGGGGESSQQGVKRKREDDILQKPFQKGRHSKVAHRSFHSSEVDREEARNRRAHLISLNAFERHKKFVSDYILYYGGKLEDLRRSTEKDKTDLDVVRENHRFLWRDEDEEDMTCLAFDGELKMKWSLEKLPSPWQHLAGQFQCGSRRCEKEQEQEVLKSWEVNFSYVECGEKRNALVKLRLCPECSFKLNYHHKRKQVKVKKKKQASSSLAEGQEVEPMKKKAKKEKRKRSKKHKRKGHRKSRDAEVGDAGGRPIGGGATGEAPPLRWRRNPGLGCALRPDSNSIEAGDLEPIGLIGFPTGLILLRLR
ncbi:hypothetical protein CRUP_005289 [Coryphaenoides rupestris]|nr:hypothetical protein CRUP_005289 [Coryphaenoides rupestris]